LIKKIIFFLSLFLRSELVRLPAARGIILQEKIRFQQISSIVAHGTSPTKNFLVKVRSKKIHQSPILACTCAILGRHKRKIIQKFDADAYSKNKAAVFRKGINLKADIQTSLSAEMPLGKFQE